MEEVIIFTRIARFEELSKELQREITIYALLDDNHIGNADVIFFSDFMPQLLLQCHQGKLSYNELFEMILDYCTQQLLPSLTKMYESCVCALASENVISWPQHWDKPRIEQIDMRREI